MPHSSLRTLLAIESPINADPEPGNPASGNLMPGRFFS
jgi:hypothetical protein